MPRENKKVISKLSHLELVHDNPKAAAEFMKEAFGAVQVEKQWSGWLSDTFNIDCIHMMFGGVVYQILKPSEGLPSHVNVLKTEGPCIHNLSLQVNDAKKFRKKLLAMGVKELHNWEKSIDMNAAGFSVEQNPIDAWMFDAMEQCGLRFEFVENCPEWEPGEQE